jgi:2-polyprenyl-3-methyl-5-hydroxy-6-metoxy-1,4-benzoquinol methylase
VPEAPPEILDSGAPAVESVAVDVCDVCGSTAFHEIAAGYDYELLTCTNRWHYVRCEPCGMVWLNPRPAVSALSTIYPPTYYAYNYDQLSPIARKGKEAMDALKLKSILAVGGGATPTRYLDVGCGDGRYLEIMAKKGVPKSDLYGLELDQRIVDELAGKGFNVHCERVESATSIPEASFDLITMFHVIEHVASPREVVAKLVSLLKPGGVLAMETPNIDSLDARLFASGTWGGFHIPRHWYLFDPSTFRRLAADAGLSVEAIKYQTGHAFWAYSFHHKLRYGSKPRRRLARFFDPLNSVPPVLAFTAFDRARSLVGAKTSAMLLLARKPG